MAKSRNERRKAAQARLLAKSERIAKAELARREDVKFQVVRENLSKPKERKPLYIVKGEVAGGDGFYPQSNMSKFAGSSHRGYVTQATGSMSKRSTLAVMSKKANREKSFDPYARPKEATPHDWKIRED